MTVVRLGAYPVRMFAIAAAVVFALGLILDWADVKTSDLFNAHAFLLLGLLLLALHLAGFPRRVRNP